MSDNYHCWKCSAALTGLIFPMSRREECQACSADQHVCKMCVFFDGRHCDEEQAEDVNDTERANFCDYFKAQILSNSPATQAKSEQAKADFAALFGDPTPDKNQQSDKLLSPAELAEKKLRDMLNR